MTQCHRQWTTPTVVILPPVPTDDHPWQHCHHQQQRQSDRQRRRRRRTFLCFFFLLAVAAAAAMTSTAASHRHSFAVAVNASSDRAAAFVAASRMLLPPCNDYECKQLSIPNRCSSSFSMRRLQETAGTASTAASNPLASTDPTHPYNFITTAPNDITNEDAGDPL